VKETAFSGAFALRDHLRTAGADVVAHDTLLSETELRALGFEPHTLGDSADAAIVQADHDRYRSFGPADLAMFDVVYDGRGLLANGGNVMRLGSPDLR
jgi:UDP-N-acetyl-D-glucosamine dehydrogenase